MLVGTGVIIVMVVSFWVSLSETRSKAINDAWEVYENQRTKDGLGRAMGYEKKKSSD